MTASITTDRPTAYEQQGHPLTVDLPAFRAYAPETDRDEDGNVITSQRCEELLYGRWEPFVSILSVRRAGSNTANPRAVTCEI